MEPLSHLLTPSGQRRPLDQHLDQHRHQPQHQPPIVTGCGAQTDEAGCEKAGCEWLAGIKVCIDKALSNPFFNAQSALAYTRAKQLEANATSGYYSPTLLQPPLPVVMDVAANAQNLVAIKRISIANAALLPVTQAHQMHRTSTMRSSLMDAPARRSIAMP